MGWDHLSAEFSCLNHPTIFTWFLQNLNHLQLIFKFTKVKSFKSFQYLAGRWSDQSCQSQHILAKIMHQMWLLVIWYDWTPLNCLCPSIFSCPADSSIGDFVTHWLTEWPFKTHTNRVTLETCDLWDIWSEWWGNMTWPKKRQWQRQIQRQRQIHLESTFKEQP